MREVIDLLSSDISDISLFDDESLTGDNPSNVPYFSSRHDSLTAVSSVEAYTYDFERLFSIKGTLQLYYKIP